MVKAIVSVFNHLGQSSGMDYLDKSLNFLNGEWRQGNRDRYVSRKLLEEQG